ncbi:hypothetical protein SDC9_04231 [bioreactor metagenome]|uniref:Uncharacterized protein n=1 Tax=bioreactor metagenome TaxID=1076179 RepID=A0A644SVH2_9ZZZZ
MPPLIQGECLGFRANCGLDRAAQVHFEKHYTVGIKDPAEGPGILFPVLRRVFYILKIEKVEEVEF